MRTSHEELIQTSQGKLTFHLTQLGGMAAGRALVRVAPHLPKLFSSFAKLNLAELKELKDAQSLKKLDLSKITSKLDFAAIGDALANLAPEDFEKLTLELLAGSFAVSTDERTGEQIKLDLTRGTLDTLFAGHVWDLFKLIGCAVSLNYFGFSHALNEKPATSGR